MPGPRPRLEWETVGRTQPVCARRNQESFNVSLIANLHVEQLTHEGPDRRTVAEMQRKAIKQGKRNAASRLFHAKLDKDTIAGWKQDLNKILQISNVRLIVLVLQLQLELPLQTELLMNNNLMLLDTRRNAAEGQEGTDNGNQSVSPKLSSHQRLDPDGFQGQAGSVVVDVGGQQPCVCSVPLGELPPPSPRACFGRDELFDKLVSFAENLEPIALIVQEESKKPLSPSLPFTTTASRTDLATTAVHPLRSVPGHTRSFPRPALQGHWRRNRKPRGPDTLTAPPFISGDLPSS